MTNDTPQKEDKRISLRLSTNDVMKLESIKGRYGLGSDTDAIKLALSLLHAGQLFYKLPRADVASSQVNAGQVNAVSREPTVSRSAMYMDIQQKKIAAEHVIEDNGEMRVVVDQFSEDFPNPLYKPPTVANEQTKEEE